MVWLEWAAVVMPGDPVMYCVARDITQRRVAEENQAFLAAMVQASHDAILGVDPGGTIRAWNAGAEELYGYTAAEAIGRPVTLIVPPELQEKPRGSSNGSGKASGSNPLSRSGSPRTVAGSPCP